MDQYVRIEDAHPILLHFNYSSISSRLSCSCLILHEQKPLQTGGQVVKYCELRDPKGAVPSYHSTGY